MWGNCERCELAKYNKEYERNPIQKLKTNRTTHKTTHKQIFISYTIKDPELIKKDAMAQWIQKEGIDIFGLSWRSRRGDPWSKPVRWDMTNMMKHVTCHILVNIVSSDLSKLKFQNHGADFEILRPWDSSIFFPKAGKITSLSTRCFFSTLGFHDSGQAPMNSQTICMALLDNKRCNGK